MSSILSSREKKIILSIIRSSHGITLQEVSVEVGVSRRTVLREISTVYKWFEKRGYTVERHSSKGLHLVISEHDKKLLLEELNTEKIIHYYSINERSLYIVTELLQTKESLKLSYFSTVLGVSEASISSDLNRVEEWLKKYDLVLERKQGYGIEVLGTEKNKRRALVSIVYEMLDGNQLRTVVQQQLGIDDHKIKVTSKVRINLLNMIDIETIQMIEQAILESEADMGFKFAESSYTALAVHLALAVKRILNKENIKINAKILEDIKLHNEYIVAAKLIRSLEEQLDIKIPDDEIAYVSLHLKGARYKNGLSDSSFIKFNERIISNYELTSMINKMIDIASKETGFNLKNVESLLIGLVDHLRPAINRIQLSLDIRNPLLKKIKTEFKEVFAASVKASQVLNDQLGINLPESEIGFIAMHIGSAIEQLKRNQETINDQYNVVVTCISGIGTSKMLAERLKKEFDNLNIVEVFSSTNLKDEWLKRNEIDLILSTVYFDSNEVPVLMVNPLLMDTDIKKIKQKLSTLTIVKKKKTIETEQDFYNRLTSVKDYSSAIIEILDHLIIETNLKFKTYNDLVGYISGTFSQNPETLLEDFERREEIGKIVFEKELVSFLHARSDAVNELHVGIFRNKYMIHDDTHKYDTVLVLVAPIKVSKSKLEVMGEISGRVISEENFLHELRNLSESGLYKRIQKFLQQFFNKINK